MSDLKSIYSYVYKIGIRFVPKVPFPQPLTLTLTLFCPKLTRLRLFKENPKIRRSVGPYPLREGLQLPTDRRGCRQSNQRLGVVDALELSKLGFAWLRPILTA